MVETDTIAYFYPVFADRIAYPSTLKAIESVKNQSRYLPTRRDRPPLSSTLSQDRLDIDNVDHRGRVPTEEPKEEEQHSVEDEPCLHATFSNGPKTRHGLIAGWDPKSDICLPRQSGVSFHHFSLTFNHQYLPIIRDLGSSYGTSITYGTDQTEPRSSFDWIVSGHNFLRKSSIYIRVTNKLQFYLVIPEHDIKSPSYRAKVDKFLEGTTNTDELLNEIKLVSRAQTTVTTGTHTPRKGPIILKKEIGQGAFAVVYRAFNVSTGEEWASKELSKEGKKNISKSEWKKEAGIMQRVSHDHIVKFLGVDSHPTALRLEYVPGGSLEDHLKKRNYFNGYECKQITCQLTSALAYLHEELDPQIVHRDIKVENILVFSRQDGKIVVKFADFGLAKEGDYLKTFCGTLRNLPPELSDIPWTGYTAAVDMWSLGVVITQLLCGLPKWKSKEYTQDYTLWCAAIRQRLENWYKMTNDNLTEFLLEAMVIIDADARWTAVDCYLRAVHLPDGPRATWKVLVPAMTVPPTLKGDTSGDDNKNDGDEDQSEQSTIHAGVEGDDDDEARTVIIRTTAGMSADPGMNPLSSLDSASLAGYLTGLSDLRGDKKYVKSDAQGPDNLAPTVQKIPIDEYLDKFLNPHDSLFMSSFGQSTMSGNSSGRASGSRLDMESSVQAPQAELPLASEIQVPEIAVAPQDDISNQEWSGEVLRLPAALITDGLNSELPVDYDEWLASTYMSRNTQKRRKRSRSKNSTPVASLDNSSRTESGRIPTQDHTMKRRNTGEKSDEGVDDAN